MMTGGLIYYHAGRQCRLPTEEHVSKSGYQRYMLLTLREQIR